ncbi:MAG: hypothetical protein LBV08_04750, partial [Clostridiales bacterium]|nr:hypothetical protein [Clostridiales bacterium]
MDIKLRSNGPEGEEKKLGIEAELAKGPEVVLKKHKRKNGFVAYIILLLAISTLVCAAFSRWAYNGDEPTFGSQEEEGIYYFSMVMDDYETQRYAKNLNRFFIDFGGFSFNEEEFRQEYRKGIEAKAGDSILQYKTDPDYLNERVNIENFYNEILIGYYSNGSDEEPQLGGNNSGVFYNAYGTGEQVAHENIEGVLAERAAKLEMLDKTYEAIYLARQEVESGYSIDAQVEEEVNYYYQIGSYLESNQDFGYLIKDNREEKNYHMLNGVSKGLSDSEYIALEEEIKRMPGAYVVPLNSDRLGGVEFNGELLNISFSKNNITGYYFATAGLVEKVEAFKYENFDRGNFIGYITVFSVFAAIMVIVLLFLYRHDLGAFKRGSIICYNFYAKIPMIIKLGSAVFFPIIFLMLASYPGGKGYFVFGALVGPFAYMSIAYFIKHIFKNF